EGKSVARQFLVHDTGIVKEIRVARMRDAVGKFLRIGGRDEQHANFLRGWGSLWHRHSGHGIPSIHAQRNVKIAQIFGRNYTSRSLVKCFEYPIMKAVYISEDIGILDADEHQRLKLTAASAFQFHSIGLLFPYRSLDLNSTLVKRNIACVCHIQNAAR